MQNIIAIIMIKKGKKIIKKIRVPNCQKREASRYIIKQKMCNFCSAMVTKIISLICICAIIRCASNMKIT